MKYRIYRRKISKTSNFKQFIVKIKNAALDITRRSLEKDNLPVSNCNCQFICYSTAGVVSNKFCSTFCFNKF